MNKKLFLLSVLTATLALLLSGCQTSREELVANALGGSAFHQALLADAYLNGYGFNVDYPLAAKWAKEAAAQQDPDGMYIYGVICEYGLGIAAADFRQADELYRKAIPGLKTQNAKGNPQAIYDLGCAYLYGRGVARDYAAARVMLESAARKGFSPAYAKLGLLYRNGWGVKADRDQAKSLLLRSANDGMPEAQYTLAECYLDAGNLTAARNWYREAAARNYPPALTALAEILRDGHGTEANPEQAKKLLERAVATGYPPAMMQLADLYYKDPADRDKASPLYLDAVGKNYAPACAKLADIYAGMSKENPENAVRAMILYRLTDNIYANPDYRRKMAALDIYNAQYFFIEFGWQDVRDAVQFLKYEAAMPAIVATFQNGQEQESHRMLAAALKQDAAALFLSNDWYEIYRRHLPPSWAGEIFQANAVAMAGKPSFWLSYGTCANLNGRPELAMTAVNKLEKMLVKMPAGHIAETWKTLTAMIRTEALLQRDMTDNAYDQLTTDGKLELSPQLENYLNSYCPAIMRDRERFAKATGMTGLLKPGLKVPAMPSAQPFYDYSLGKTTQPQAIIPEPELKKEQLFIPANQ